MSEHDGTLVNAVRRAVAGGRSEYPGPERRAAPLFPDWLKYVIGTFLPVIGLGIGLYVNIKIAEKDLRDLELRHDKEIVEIKESHRRVWERYETIANAIRNHDH